MFCLLTAAALAVAPGVTQARGVIPMARQEVVARHVGQDEDDRVQRDHEQISSLVERLLAGIDRDQAANLKRQEQSIRLYEKSQEMAAASVDQSGARLRWVQNIPGRDARDVAQFKLIHDQALAIHKSASRLLKYARADIEWAKRVMAAPPNQRAAIQIQRARAMLELRD